MQWPGFNNTLKCFIGLQSAIELACHTVCANQDPLPLNFSIEPFISKCECFYFILSNTLLTLLLFFFLTKIVFHEF